MTGPPPPATVVAPTSDVVPRAMVLELLGHARAFSRSLPADSPAERQLRWLIEWAHRAGIGEPMTPPDGRVRVLVVLPTVETLAQALRSAVFGSLDEIDHQDAAALLEAGRQLHDLLRAGS